MGRAAPDRGRLSSERLPDPDTAIQHANELSAQIQFHTPQNASGPMIAGPERSDYTVRTGLISFRQRRRH